MRLLTRQGTLIEEQGMTYLAEADADLALTPLQAASCTYRIALGPRAGQKVLSLQTVPSRETESTQPGCANEQGFSLHAASRAVAAISAKNSNICAATSPARPLPMNGSSVVAPAKSCCNSRVRTEMAPPTS